MTSSILGALYLQDLVVTLLLAAGQMIGVFLILRRPDLSSSARTRLRFVTILSVSALATTHFFLYEALARHFPRYWTTWGRGMVLLWSVLSLLWLAAYGVTRPLVGMAS